MKKIVRSFIIILVVALIVCAGLFVIIHAVHRPGKLDTFAQCLDEKGATFYGAFWCPHCQRQKAMFRSSAKLLPYVECSTPNGKEQTPLCIEKNITGYPTWEFADGTRLSGEVDLQTLAEKTRCVLPQESVETPEKILHKKNK
jgi:thiol-disulfide isomerase/thioredoxin